MKVGNQDRASDRQTEIIQPDKANYRSILSIQFGDALMNEKRSQKFSKGTLYITENIEHRIVKTNRKGLHTRYLASRG